MKHFVCRVIWTSTKKVILYEMMSLKGNKKGYSLGNDVSEGKREKLFLAVHPKVDSIMVLTIIAEQNMYCTLMDAYSDVPKKNHGLLFLNLALLLTIFCWGKLSMCLNVMRKAPSALLVINRSVTCNHYHSYSTS